MARQPRPAMTRRGPCPLLPRYKKRQSRTAHRQRADLRLLVALVVGTRGLSGYEDDGCDSQPAGPAGPKPAVAYGLWPCWCSDLGKTAFQVAECQRSTVRGGLGRFRYRPLWKLPGRMVGARFRPPEPDSGSPAVRCRWPRCRRISASGRRRASIGTSCARGCPARSAGPGSGRRWIVRRSWRNGA
jgi:hypothetical protein